MLEQNEKNLLKLIKLGPALVLLIAIIISFILIKNNNQHFDEQLQKTQDESLKEKKEIIKREVEHVFEFIVDEKKRTRKDIKENLREKIYEAHTIAKSIYENNQDKSDATIKKLIFDALRNIRFNDGRGYFFIYTIDGVNMMHPILKHLEGKDLWHFKDKKGLHVTKELKKIVTEKREGFLNWWWTKPSDKENTFEKIGFVKGFEPYNWYIGTGEYVLDYEEVLKKKILERITRIRFGKDGYIFIVNKEGETLAHKHPQNIGKILLDLQDKNGFFIIREIIKLAQKSEGFISYIYPNREKVSYVKGYNTWDWAIGSGVYVSEINEETQKKRDSLIQKSKDQLNHILVISIILFLFLFILSIYFERVIRARFMKYKLSVHKKSSQLERLNNTLEEKVSIRTKEIEETNKRLNETITSLKETKKDLITSQKMATLGELVSSITHEINNPLGISITSNSHVEEITKKITKAYNEENMTEEDFDIFLKDLGELSKIISINLNSTAKLVRTFKSVAVDQAVEEKRSFNLKNYIDEILLALKSKTKAINMEIKVECSQKIILDSYPNFIFQIFTNLINNSILHGFSKDKKGIIDIQIEENNNLIEIAYMDNGKGIPKENINNIFDQYFTTKKGQGGTGLGLNIIKKIVEEKLNGEIKIDSSMNNGVKFLIKIPKNL